MKKIFVIACAAAMFMTMVSCGETEIKAEAAYAKPAEQTATAEAPAAMFSDPAEEAQPAVPASGEKIEVSGFGYTLEVLSAAMTKDYFGNDIMYVKYKLTNNSGAPKAFWEIIKESVSCGGQKLSCENIVTADPFLTGGYITLNKGDSVICGTPYPYVPGATSVDVTVSVYNYATQTAVSTASGTVEIG